MADPMKGFGLPMLPAMRLPSHAPGGDRLTPMVPSTLCADGGVAAATRIFAAPDFAADLARLVALLGAGDGDMDVDAEAAPAVDGQGELPEAGIAADVTVVALCAEVEVAQQVAAPVVEPATADRVAGTSFDDSSAPARAPQVATAMVAPGLDRAVDDRAMPPPAVSAASALNPAATATAEVDASGGSAFDVSTTTTTEAGASRVLPGSKSADAAPLAPVAFAATADVGPRPVPTAIMANVVDVLQPQGGRQIAETVAWHVPAQGAAEVRIRLNPEELGALDVQLKLDGDKVSVRFDLADERVRDVVQSSLPSLSSMLSARGLQLDQAQVFARGQGSPQHPESSQAPWSSVAREGDDAEPAVTSVARPLIRRGLLDDYA